MKKIIIPLLFSLIPAKSFALNVGDITSFLNSDQTTLAREISNDSDNGRWITIKIKRISSPREGGTTIPMDQPGEMLLSPASILLPAHSAEIIHFYYKGPQDDKERYYRIVWTDRSVDSEDSNTTKRHAVATTSSVIGTILVASPRQLHFNYKYENQSITNTGNATLNIVAFGPCLDTKSKTSCKENYYLMPGQKRSFTKVNMAKKDAHLSFWIGEKFVPVK